MSVLARLLQRADDEPIVIEEMRRKHLTHDAPRSSTTSYPKPWSRAVFESELDQVRARQPVLHRRPPAPDA